MNSESKSKFNLWLSEHPESFHPSDEARMFDLVNTLYETEGYDEQEYMRYRKQTEIIVTIFYEGILRGTQYGNHPRTKYALKIHCIIEELMNKDWSKVKTLK